ncbi:hypothetical protein ACPCTK_07715 [Streptomyces pseudogriseolus]|uniref:hypothetical protein n=1 Tax=Streptomyces pseudogriseolus TaxID=36817 RepID=UPI003FA2F170
MGGDPAAPRQHRPAGRPPARPGVEQQGAPGSTVTTDGERRRLELEKKRERYVWLYLGYFLFGIHIVAFVMIYAVKHAK